MVNINVLSSPFQEKEEYMDKFILKLYILGQSAASRRAVKNLEKICQENLQADQYELTIIDIMENPEKAEESKIVAIPTLIKEYPLPARRIIGDLSDTETVLAELEVE
jgi:circadian clock protein KaiB